MCTVMSCGNDLLDFIVAVMNVIVGLMGFCRLEAMQQVVAGGKWKYNARERNDFIGVSVFIYLRHLNLN